jgi:hypothetical protein
VRQSPLTLILANAIAKIAINYFYFPQLAEDVIYSIWPEGESRKILKEDKELALDVRKEVKGIETCFPSHFN